MQNTTGKFIVIDGTDGSGKTTQFNLLVAKLRGQGHQVEVADFPQYNTKSAGLVEEYLSGKYGAADEVPPKLASIFYACDRYDASFKIRQWLNQGKIVVTNRYVSSNMGHQGGKIPNLEDRKKFFEWLFDLEYNIFNIPKPDISIILHVPSLIAQELAKQRHREDWSGKTIDIHEEDLEHLQNAEQVYLEIASLPGFTLINCAENDAMMLPEKIHELIWQKTRELFIPKCAPIKRGWIEVICGCMFSGKSESANQIISREKHSKLRRVLSFDPECGKRQITCNNGESIDTGGKTASRSGVFHEAIVVRADNPRQIIEHIKHLPSDEQPTTVIIEEAHFFSMDLFAVCKELADEYNIRVIAVGLDQDFEGKPFGPVPSLMVEADYIEKNRAVCNECGHLDASKTWLDTREVNKASGNILVGDKQYKALCRHCWKKYKEQYKKKY